MDKVCDWLNSIGPQYGQYADLFEAQGWDDLDNVATMAENDIQTLGITKPGHVNKLKIAIQILYHEQEQYAFKSQNLSLEDSKSEQNQDKVQKQNLSKEANQNEESPGGATCYAITTEVQDGAQQLAWGGTVIADPHQSRSDTALALTHGTQTDESCSDSDEDITEPSHNVVMLPPSHAMSTERRPTVAHLNAVSSRSVHRSTVVQGSKDVTIAETVEIHKHEHTDDSQDNYKGQIKTFMRNYKRTEHLFVKTRAYKEVSDILEDGNWAVIIGNPGYGKSTMALHQMLEHSRQGYEPIIQTSVTDWKSMIEGQEKDSKKQCVLIDDIFGSLSVDGRKLHDWSVMFDMIDKLIIERKGSLKVICTIRKHIFLKVSTKLKRFKLFGKLHMVDMEEDRYKLLQTEKVEMLTKYFKHYTIKMEETFIDSASKVASGYGFPHCVEMFCTASTLRERGLTFFKAPVDLLEKEIENLVEYDKEKYCALLIVLLSPSNTFNITYLDHKDLEFNYLYQKHPELYYFSYVGLMTESDILKKIKDLSLKAISDSLKLSRTRGDTFLPDFVSVFKLLNNVFIKEIENNIYTFKHDSLKEIVSIASFKYYPELSLQLFNLDIIVETTKINTYKPSLQKMVAVLPKSCTSQLIKRFNEEIQVGNNYSISKHQAWNENDFVEEWLQSIKFPSSFDNSGLIAYTGRRDSRRSCSGYKSGFLSSLCSNQKEEAVFLILEDNYLRAISMPVDWIKELSNALVHASRGDCSENLCDMLIQHGADVNYEVFYHDEFRYSNTSLFEDEIDKGISSALSYAIRFDNLEKCKYFIEKGARLFRGGFGINFVFIAAQKGSTKCLQYIIEYMNSLKLPIYFNKSKDFNTIEYLYGERYSKLFCHLITKYSDFTKAIHSSKNSQIFKILSKEYDKLEPTLFEANNEIPMILGLLKTGCLTPDLIDILVEKGCDVNMKYKGQPIMFHFFDELKFQPAKTITVLKSLLTHGLNIHATDKYGQTALSHILLYYSHGKDVLSWLLDMKVDPNIPDNDGCVPLFYAIERHDDMDILKMLLKQTKQLGNLTSISRNNCFHFLAKNHNLKVESVEELISLLLEENVNINHLNNEGKSCLALTNNTNLELLLNHGADPNIQDKKGMTAAMAFIDTSYGQRDMLESMCILMKHNMTINAKDNKGQNILHYLIKKYTCNLHIIDMFLKKSCDVNEKDNSGITPLMLAVGIKHSDESLLNFLIENEADVSNIDHSGRSVLDHCLESSLRDPQKADFMKVIISTKGFPGVKASSVTYALKECEQGEYILLIMKHKV